jgi:hypothetical protein
MDAAFAELARSAVAAQLLGWLNLSDGRPNPKWQRQLDDAFDVLARRHVSQPWVVFRSWLLAEAQNLKADGQAAFQDTTQAKAAIDLVFDHVLPAYRRHHNDMLAHQTETGLFTPYFVARAFEAVLSQGAPWMETERIVQGTLVKLNDYVGHRPIAVLESRPQTELYAHEKVRPVPIYLRGAGVAHGRYHDLVEQGLELLRQTDPDLLAEAQFDFELLDELAYDPRAYDHGHPVNRRPNYLFGEWDPHWIDNRGRYRRFVVRQNTLEAMLSRLHGASGTHLEELKYEAAAVFAGTVLMASGTSGNGPTAYDSTVTLSKLVPRIAHYRDAFYKRLITQVMGVHGERLRLEATQLRQPFAACRQHLNQALARERAVELQESLLARIFAAMGYPEASRRRAAKVSAASVRILTEIQVRLTMGRFAIENGEAPSAATLLEEAEDLLHRGIECGALPDPWNAIGFQGLFPLFQSREDSLPDTRLEDLIDCVSGIFHLYAAVMAAAASSGADALCQKAQKRMERLSIWWDQHATFEVSDLPRVHGGERTAAAVHVAEALMGVRQHSPVGPSSGQSPASDLKYWRQYRSGFRSPAAFAQVVDALLRLSDFRASLSLLMTWLSEAGEMALEEGESSFHLLARRWFHAVTSADLPGSERWSLLVRFFELIEANADEFWTVPGLTLAAAVSEEKEETFEAAYAEMTYHDSTDDGEEGMVAGGPAHGDFPLEEEVDRLEARLGFLATVAGLWQQAVLFIRAQKGTAANLEDSLSGWCTTAESWQAPLVELLDSLHNLKVPEPLGGFEDVMEYDRRRVLRDQLAEAVIDTCLETGRAIRMLGSLRKQGSALAVSDPIWEPHARRLEAAVGCANGGEVRRLLPDFLEKFRPQPLLFVPMSAAGHPRQILRSRQAQAMLRSLLEQLPRLGLIRESFHLIQIAREMEQNAPPEGRKISEFDHLFPFALQSVLEALLDAAHSWSGKELSNEESLVVLLRRITDSFLALWLSHSQTLRLSVLESFTAEADWEGLRDFIKRYGNDIFTPQFLSIASLRSVLHRGVGPWLDSVEGTDEAPKLLEDLVENKYPRWQATHYLETIVQAMLEHHEEYRDYNSTTTQSDYGENLHILLDFLKIKVAYERYAWRMRPLVLAHEVLCHRRQDDAALRWQASMASFTRDRADELLRELADLEQKHGLRVRTIRDRLEERFVQPLVIDRICALAEPAMHEAPDPPLELGAFLRLERQLPLLADQPLGIGLDAPAWIERLQDEVERVREEEAGGDQPVARGLAPGIKLSYAELQRQLVDWEKPL